MAEQINLNQGECEKAIVRILNSEGVAVGTGFLAAPGYVLTCAHVVLQSQGVSPAEYATHLDKPEGFVSLEFALRPDVCAVTGEVVEWLPYNEKSGDVAILKLQSSAPEDVQFLPVVSVPIASLKTESHCVYGFPQETGDCSAAYQPKATVYGGRLQLCKTQDPNDETIEPGYSGGPVFNESRGCIIGMIATVSFSNEPQKNKAYAITQAVLAPLLKTVQSRCLHDVLVRLKQSCSSDAERVRFQYAIADALKVCHPNADLKGDRAIFSKLRQLDTDELLLEQLLELGTNRSLPVGWESVGHLVRMAVQLARLISVQQMSKAAYDMLKAWVKQQGYAFSALYEQVASETWPQAVPSNNRCEHLMVVLEPVGIANRVQVSLWAISDRASYEPSQVVPFFLSENENAGTNEVEEGIAITELAPLIRDQVQRRFTGTVTPLVHLFVPLTVLDQSFDMNPCGRRGRQRLGCEYPLVLRTNLSLYQTLGFQYYEVWNEKWKLLEQQLSEQSMDVFQSVDCTDLDAALDEIGECNAVVLNNCSDLEELFYSVADETALPVALWVRDGSLQEEITDVLDCALTTLPTRIRRERQIAHQNGRTASQSEGNALLGHNLSLMWEDPKVVPRDMQFDPEDF